MKGVRFAITTVLLAVALAGCASTRNTLFVEADDAVRDADYSRALQIVESNQDRMYTSRDGVLFYLDTGMLLHYDGEYRESTERLEEAERLIEEYFTRSISQAAATFLINDAMRDYGGEDFEDIYLNVFKALNFLGEGRTESALVEARRINIKLNLLEDKYQSLAAGYARAEEADGPEIRPGENRFYNSALARYVSLVLNRAEGNADGVRIDWQFVQEAFRQQSNLYDFPLPLDESTARMPADSRLSVLAFAGRSPVKLAQTLWILTGDNMVTIIYAEEDERLGRIPQGLASFYFPGVEGGYRFKFELPRLHPRGSEVTHIRVVADGRVLGEVEMLENMEEIALDTYRIKEPIVFIKTVTRTLVKSLVGARAGQAMRQAGSESGTAIGMIAGILGSIATEIVLDASEQADLRVSRYFPAYAYVGEWDLPAGEYEIDVEYYRGGQLLYVDRLGRVPVSPRSPNLLSSYLAR
ncbi:MAG: hypothetical protein EA427_06260 [Spirochaetaceae bacterium]|nr:MAG: hypothetical protein EA427_06260 [Spirochaetaceae bacterium]